MKKWDENVAIVSQPETKCRDADKENDNMEDWDEEKLNEVVNKKHAHEKANKTDIVSKQDTSLIW